MSEYISKHVIVYIFIKDNAHILISIQWLELYHML